MSDIEELRTELAKRSHDATMPFFISKEEGASIVAALARLTPAEAVCEAIMEDPNNVGIGVVEALANYWALVDDPL